MESSLTNLFRLMTLLLFIIVYSIYLYQEGYVNKGVDSVTGLYTDYIEPTEAAEEKPNIGQRRDYDQSMSTVLNNMNRECSRLLSEIDDIREQTRQVEHLNEIMREKLRNQNTQGTSQVVRSGRMEGDAADEEPTNEMQILRFDELTNRLTLTGGHPIILPAAPRQEQ